MDSQGIKQTVRVNSDLSTEPLVHWAYGAELAGHWMFIGLPACGHQGEAELTQEIGTVTCPQCLASPSLEKAKHYFK